MANTNFKFHCFECGAIVAPGTDLCNTCRRIVTHEVANKRSYQ